MTEMNALPAVTAKNYFDPDIEIAYMGSTQVKNFMRCEAAELARLKGEYRPAATTAMLVGSYVDAHFEGSLDVFQAQHPELFKRDGTLKAEFSRANDIISRMETDELYSLLMSGQKQVICTGEIAGVPFKAKIDRDVRWGHRGSESHEGSGGRLGRHGAGLRALLEGLGV